MSIDEEKSQRYLLPKIMPLIGLISFLIIAAAVISGLTVYLDRSVLVALRNNRNLSAPIYGYWLLPFMRIITSLGNFESLTLITIIFALYLVLRKKYRFAVIFVFVVLSGSLIDFLLKSAFARARPVIVPHLAAAYYYSFPSGHAFITTILFCTAAVIILKSINRKIIKRLIISFTVIILLLIGFSRIYLGVHFPSDVLGGWSIGLFWFSFVWIFSEKIAMYPGEKGP